MKTIGLSLVAIGLTLAVTYWLAGLNHQVSGVLLACAYVSEIVGLVFIFADVRAAGK